MRTKWGAPDTGWPTFDENGKRIRPHERAEGYDRCARCGITGVAMHEQGIRYSDPCPGGIK